MARYLGVTARTVERWHAQGKIPAPAHVNDKGWKFWSAEQGREILAWHLNRKSQDRRI